MHIEAKVPPNQEINYGQATMRHSYAKRSKACSVIDVLKVSINMWQMSYMFAGFHLKLYKYSIIHSLDK
jgi:hypothetical protein